MKQYFVLKLEAYASGDPEGLGLAIDYGADCQDIEGETEACMYCIARLNEDGTLEIDDYGYKTREDAEAVCPKNKTETNGDPDAMFDITENEEE